MDYNSAIKGKERNAVKKLSRTVCLVAFLIVVALFARKNRNEEDEVCA